MKLAILIPALNEEKTIGKVIDSLPKSLNGIEKITVIVVNDGSTDKTEEIAKSKGAVVVKHQKNMGVGKSFQDGLERAIELKNDILVTVDADEQFDTSEIPKLIKPILSNEAHLATGSRFIDKAYTPKNMPWIKQWGNKRVAGIISMGTGKKFYDVSCGFRAYSLEAMLRMNLFGKFTYTQETFLDLAYKGLEIVEVPVTVKYYEDRKSRVASSIFGYAFKSANIIFRTIKDYKPLRFFGISGLILFFLGLGLGIFVFIHFLNHGTFSPYKIVGFLAAFLSAVGVMIAFIGILADLIDKVRLTQEKLLYYEKKRKYEE